MLGLSIACVAAAVAWAYLVAAHGGFWRTSQRLPPVTAEPGFPTRAQAVARYAAQTGFDVASIDWYQAFAYFKLAIICQGIALRAAGGSMLGSGFDTAQAMVEPLARAGLHVL